MLARRSQRESVVVLSTSSGPVCCIFRTSWHRVTLVRPKAAGLALKAVAGDALVGTQPDSVLGDREVMQSGAEC